MRKLFLWAAADFVKIGIGLIAALLLVVTIAGSFYAAKQIFFSMRGDEVYSSKDIIQEWLLSKAILASEDPYLPIKELADRFLGEVHKVQNGSHPTPHPPTAGLLFMPLAFLDYRHAVYAWFVFELACLSGSLYLINRTLKVQRPLVTALWFTPLAAVWGPAAYDLALGQLMIVQLLLLSAAWLCVSKNNFGAAGALIGLGILIKPMLWPVAIFFLLKRSWRGLLTCGGVIIAGCGSSLLILGTAKIYRYVSDILPAVDRIYASSLWNVSLRSLGLKLFQGTSSPVHNTISSPPVIDLPVLAATTGIIMPLFLLAITAYVSHRVGPLAGFALLIIPSILSSPIAWGSYLTLLALPIAWVIRAAFLGKASRGQVFLASVLGLILFPPWSLWLRIIVLLSGQVPTSEHAVTIPSGLALITFVPTVATLALIILIVRIERHGFERSAMVMAGSL